MMSCKKEMGVLILGKEVVHMKKRGIAGKCSYPSRQAAANQLENFQSWQKFKKSSKKSFKKMFKKSSKKSSRKFSYPLIQAVLID